MARGETGDNCGVCGSVGSFLSGSFSVPEGFHNVEIYHSDFCKEDMIVQERIAGNLAEYIFSLHCALENKLRC